MVVVRWNNIDALKDCFATYGDRIAACIMEPVMGNSGVIPPKEGYLNAVRELTLDYDSLLIFDEVITGFRVAPEGHKSIIASRPTSRWSPRLWVPAFP